MTHMLYLRICLSIRISCDDFAWFTESKLTKCCCWSLRSNLFLFFTQYNFRPIDQHLPRHKLAIFCFTKPHHTHFKYSILLVSSIFRFRFSRKKKLLHKLTWRHSQGSCTNTRRNRSTFPNYKPGLLRLGSILLNHLARNHYSSPSTPNSWTVSIDLDTPGTCLRFA